jgi:hypothetical protein
MNDLTGQDYVLQPTFRLLLDHELEDRARKDESNICLVAGCEEQRYLDGGHTWIVCGEHREKFLRSMGEWDDMGFSQMVTDEFKRKMKFGTGRPQVIEEISLAEVVRREPRRGRI